MNRIQVSWPRLIALALALVLVACSSAPPSRWDQAQSQTQGNQAAAVVRESEQGGTFNQFFPKVGEGYERVYTQEKKGFAEAKLIKDGQTLAMLAIADTLNNPSAIDKFKASTTEIAGFPAIEQGTTATALLVSDRYQVKVISRDPSFTAADRQEWLTKFNLQGLAQLSDPGTG